MQGMHLSSKRILILKANSLIVIVSSVAVAITVFSLVASRNLLKQNSYQQRVIKERKASLDTLKSNVKASESLVATYKAFDSNPESVLGTKDNNTKIVLDALPSKYDFPALASSLEKILTSGGYTIESITGSDNELGATQDSPSPIPIEMPFQVGARGTYDSVQKLIVDFERSIRPFKVKSLDLSGSDSAVRINIEASTFYQPERNLDVKTKVIK